MLTKRVASFNAQLRYNVDKDTWPPDQSHHFTPLLLLRNVGAKKVYQSVEVAKLVHKGDITSNTEVHTKLTNKIEDISKMVQEQRSVLIKGAPGIGKSVLLREIAYRWGRKESLQDFKLVLLVCLRDPGIQQAELIDDLLLPFCKGDRKANQIVSACSDYLVNNGGKDLLLLFDGLDEYPEHLRESGIAGKIMSRNILPLCGLVVSSRPHVMVNLPKQSVEVDILGFSEEERYHYIKDCFKEDPKSIEELSHYLDEHHTINKLCLVPLNIVILLFLYKMGITLPSNPTSLYHHFICQTICRHLIKHGIEPTS